MVAVHTPIFGTGVKRAFSLVAVLVATLSVPNVGYAWGAQGHRLVAHIAEQALDERTRVELRAVLGSESLADASVWLDQQKQRLRHEWPGSERWHYDDWPVCERTPQVTRYCAQGQCASEAYARALARLADHAAPQQERLVALRIVVHVLEDVHQPLHAADHGDHGGTQIYVLYGDRRRPVSLHSLWDDELVRRALRPMDEAEFVARAASSAGQARREAQAGDLSRWMAESHQIAREFVYGRLPGFDCDHPSPALVTLPNSYLDAASSIVRDRLAAAGVRLAAVLRAAL
jgi:hypothetical protein